MHTPNVVAPIDPRGQNWSIFIKHKQQHIFSVLHVDWGSQIFKPEDDSQIAQEAQMIIRKHDTFTNLSDLIQSDRFQQHKGCMHQKH
jgi:hypothetical protein